MTTRRLLLALLVMTTIAVAASVLRARSTAERRERTFTVTGTVVDPPAGARVTVAHEAIDRFMPAMTMPFVFDDAAEVARLEPGDQVRFVLRVSEESSRGHAVVVTGRDAALAARIRSAPATQRVKPGQLMPAFALIDQEGQLFTDAQLRGRVTALTFIFTRCPLPEFCPLMVKRFREVQTAAATDSALRDRLQLVSVTLDPAFDTPEVLSAYAGAMKADPRSWRFLTGKADALAGVTRAFAIHTERSGGFLDHTLATAVIDADGRVVEIWRGTSWTAGEVVDVVRRTISAQATATDQ